MNVDTEENLPENISQHLEEDEVISTFRVPLEEFQQKVRGNQYRSHSRCRLVCRGICYRTSRVLHCVRFCAENSIRANPNEGVMILLELHSSIYVDPPVNRINLYCSFLFHLFRFCLVMNIADRGLQGKLPNNALLMFGASLGVVRAVFPHHRSRYFLHFRWCLFIWIFSCLLVWERY